MLLKDFEKIESSYIDFKINLEIDKPKSWLKTISAFANSDGGVILFGIDDKTRKPKDLEDISKVADKVTQLINTKIEPIPRYELKSFVDDNKDFLVVEVGDGPKTPYYVNEKNRTAYIRKGNESKEATKNMLVNIMI